MNHTAQPGRVSVCIPTYQRYPSLERCLQRVLDQEYHNIEVLISDNTQDREAPQSLLNLIHSDSRIRYVRQPQNIGMAQNDAFLRKNAQGEFICMLHDDDDGLPGEFLTVMMERLNSDPSLNLCGPACDRYYENTFWYSYKRFSNVGSDQETRLTELIQAAFSRPYDFEYLLHGVYRRSAIPADFAFGHWRGIVTFFYLCTMSGTIHTDSSIVLRKNTSAEDIEKHAKSGYVKRSRILKSLCRSIRTEERVTVMQRLIGFTRRSPQLSRPLKWRLVRTILREFWRNTPETGAPPLPSLTEEPNA